MITNEQSMMTNEQRAETIAKLASDKDYASLVGFEENIKMFALMQLQAAYAAGAESVRKSSDYHQREDMGR